MECKIILDPVHDIRVLHSFVLDLLGLLAYSRGEHSNFIIKVFVIRIQLQTVTAHEKAMREQAKKMNVKSLRSQEDCDKSAEAKLAKVALVTISMWFCAWTPYMVINSLGLFKFEGLTPLATIWGAMFAKTAAVYNPIVYGIR